MTKLYTAVLVMRQIEKGTLALGDTLDTWIDLPYGDTVTVEMLLNHASGVPSYTEDAWFLARYFLLARKQWEPAELARVVRNKPLKFEPGSQHEYSNSNYLPLGMILEQVTGETYGALVKDLVDETLGLNHTHYRTYSDNAAIANGYDVTLLNLGTRNLTGFPRSLESGGFSSGGVLSTSEDVASFVHALFAGQIVSESTLARMMTFVEAPDIDVPQQTGYGLGLRSLMVDGEGLMGHTGSIPGYSGIVMHNQTRGYTIAVLSNVSVIHQTEVLAGLQDIVAGE